MMVLLLDVRENQLASREDTAAGASAIVGDKEAK
jgi:hypothetical protein